MLQVSPQTTLPLVYLIQDHTDSNTYYVRAVVKNSHDGTVLKTIDLVDGGNRRFTASYNIPAMEDKYIDITTTVYSDSGYTTKAQDKYETIEQYLVKTQWGLQFGGGGGDRIVKGTEIDYKKIKKMIDDAISGIEKVEKYDDSALLIGIKTLQECINDLEIPEMPDMSKMMPEKVNLGPILQKIGDLEVILNKEPKVIEEKEFDYNKILVPLQEIRKDIQDSTKIVEKVEKIVEPKVEEVIEPKKIRVVGGYKSPKSFMPINKSRIANLIR
jgi:hypothetical protein